MKNYNYLCFALIPIMIILAIIINTNHFNNEKKEINQWVVEHNYKLVSEEWQWTIFGTPYNYVHKGEYIWKVNVLDSIDKPHVVWVRTSSWYGNDYIIK